MSKILIHLISGQTMPVYIDHEIIDPDIDACMFTESSRQQYKNIVNALENDIDEILVPPFDFNYIYSKTEIYVNEYLDKDDEIIFNFTGGTKIQSLALFNYAMANKHKAIYINTQDQEYILFSEFKEIERKKIEVTISPKTYLALGGFEFTSGSFEEYEKNSIAKKFLQIMEKHHKQLASIISNRKNRTKGRSKITIEKKFVNIQLYSGDKLLFWHRETNISKKEYNLLKKLFSPGFWLEYLTYKKIKESCKFDYVDANVKIPYGELGNFVESKNEIDVLAIDGVTPCVFECKTSSISQEEISKLISVRRTYFGRYCKLIFVGLSKPRGTNLENLIDNNIDFVRFNNLKNYLNNLNCENNPQTT